MGRLFLAAPLFILSVVTGFSPARAGPLNPPVKGPMTICFQYSVFHLREGERIVEFQSSIHQMSVRISGPRGFYEIHEGDVWVQDSAGMELVATRGDAKAYRRGPGGYLVFGPWGDKSPLLRIYSPPALEASGDTPLYMRIDVVNPGTVRCGHSFRYASFFNEE